jgi:hypothetical protein
MEREAQLAHIGRTDDVTRGYVEGTPVTALCGATIVPSRDPDRMPDCEDCARMLELLRTITRRRLAMDAEELRDNTCGACGAPLLPALGICIGCGTAEGS